ncbi:MAG: ABC transporter permease subunit [Paracoccaceae bacterium]
MQRFGSTLWAVGLLLAWEIFAQLHPDSLLIAGPTAICTYIWANLGLTTRAIGATVSSALWGFLWGNLVAVILSGMTVLFPRSTRILSAFALLVFCLPLVATGPILRVLYGPGNGPQITLAAIAVYYTTYLALLVGLRAVPHSWLDLASVYGRGALTKLVIVRARASLPYLFVGLQIAAPAALLGAMIGEFTGAERGMGVLTLRAMRGLETDATWALATLAAGLAILAYTGFGWLGRWLVGYAPVVLLSPPKQTSNAGPLIRFAELCLIVILALLVWQFSMDIFDLNRFFAKRPGDILTFLTIADNRETLFAALFETLTLTVPGYFAGLILGAALATILILLPNVSRGILPIAIALRSIPIITTAPLLVLALGRGIVGTVTIVAVMIFFPTLVACLQGLRQTSGQIVDVFESYGAGRFRLLITAQIPAMLPAFFAAARMAVPAALLAVTTAEWLATGKGIGTLMALTASTSNYNMLWSSVLVLSLAAAIGYALVAWCERVVLRTYASEQVL